MARSNYYGTDKRQRELARQRKKEEKLQRKIEHSKERSPAPETDPPLPTAPTVEP